MKGIGMCTPLAHAAYLGIKTETRRLVTQEASELAGQYRGPVVTKEHGTWPYAVPFAHLLSYKVGERHFIKEVWTLPAMWDKFPPSSIDPKRVEREIRYGYERDPKKRLADEGRYRSPRYMPLWASRTLVIVDAVYIEWLQDISEDEVLAEGMRAFPVLCPSSGNPIGNTYHWRSDASAKDRFPDPIMAFSALWDELHADTGTQWAANPRVWRIKFTKLPPADLTEYLGGRNAR